MVVGAVTARRTFHRIAVSTPIDAALCDRAAAIACNSSSAVRGIKADVRDSAC